MTDVPFFFLLSQSFRCGMLFVQKRKHDRLAQRARKEEIGSSAA